MNAKQVDTFVTLLLLYFLIQLITLFVHETILYLSYEILFFVGVTIGVIKGAKQAKTQLNLDYTKSQIRFLCLLSTILFMAYLPSMYFQEGISWTLKGDAHTDPQVYLIFYPLVHLLIGSFILYLPAYTLLKKIIN